MAPGVVAAEVQHGGGPGDGHLEGAPHGRACPPGGAAQVLQRHGQRHDVCHTGKTQVGSISFTRKSTAFLFICGFIYRSPLTKENIDNKTNPEAT